MKEAVRGNNWLGHRLLQACASSNAKEGQELVLSDQPRGPYPMATSVIIFDSNGKVIVPIGKPNYVGVTTTGGKAVIEGDPTGKFFPWLGLERMQADEFTRRVAAEANWMRAPRELALFAVFLGWIGYGLYAFAFSGVATSPGVEEANGGEAQCNLKQPVIGLAIAQWLLGVCTYLGNHLTNRGRYAQLQATRATRRYCGIKNPDKAIFGKAGMDPELYGWQADGPDRWSRDGKFPAGLRDNRRGERFFPCVLLCTLVSFVFWVLTIVELHQDCLAATGNVLWRNALLNVLTPVFFPVASCMWMDGLPMWLLAPPKKGFILDPVQHKRALVEQSKKDQEAERNAGAAAAAAHQSKVNSGGGGGAALQLQSVHGSSAEQVVRV
jgi:hypothetical protein